MISAFGVEHDIAKSYFGGGRWAPVTQMSRVDRLYVRGAHKDAKGMTKEHREFKAQQKGLRAKLEAVPQGIQRGDLFSGAAGATVRVGGKSSGRSYVVGQAPTRKSRATIAAHEAQHAKVKRSSYRLHGQIMADPKKLMREEARADILSTGKHFTRRTNPATQTNYERIANAQRRADKHPRYRPNDYGISAAMGVDKPATNAQIYQHAKKDFVRQQTALFGEHYGKGDVDANVRAYRSVQNKIRAAQARKQGPVKKSAFGVVHTIAKAKPSGQVPDELTSVLPASTVMAYNRSKKNKFQAAASNFGAKTAGGAAGTAIGAVGVSLAARKYPGLRRAVKVGNKTIASGERKMGAAQAIAGGTVGGLVGGVMGNRSLNRIRGDKRYGYK